MQILCVIPVRLGSTRLPEKPIRLLAGEPLVRHVARRALALPEVDRVVVAADDRRILDAVAGLAIEGTLTDPAHASGTERVAEVVARPEYAGYSAVVNIQGDEPFFSSEAVRGALQRVAMGDAVGTVGCPLAREDMGDVDRVKVVVDGAGHAIRFSRRYPASGVWPSGIDVLQHIGIYAYRPSALRQWLRWDPAPEEMTEGLEQLRPLHYGLRVGVARVSVPSAMAIDREEDLAKAERYLESLTQRVGR